MLRRERIMPPLQWFVDQVEEEDDAGQIVDQLEKIEKTDNLSLLYTLDKELGTRVYVPLQPTTAPGQQ